MSKTVVEPYWGGEGHYADEVHVPDRPTHSKLLGPDGRPLKYETPRVGFDTSRRAVVSAESGSAGSGERVRS